MDREKMAHDLAVAFAVSRQKGNIETPQDQLEKMFEDYCAAYGFFSSRSDEAVKELAHCGE